jgi:Holliday junction resolvase RusA-like endonuclease
MITLKLPVPPSLNNMFPSKRGKKTVAVPGNGVRLTREAYRDAVTAAETKGLGRTKSREYKDWIKRADAMFMMQRVADRKNFVEGRLATFQVRIRVPKIRGDIDNRIKAILDFLVRVGLTLDDRYARCVAIEEDLTLKGECVVTIAQRGNDAEIAAGDLPSVL